MKPDFTAPWLYQRMIWGGLWVLLVVFPSMNKGVLVCGQLFPSRP